MSAAEETLFWCVPAADEAARFRAVIDLLGAAQNAAPFQPHLTLGAVRGPVPDVRTVCDALAGLRLTPIEIAETDLFTKSLFVRFEASPALRAGRAALESLPGFRAGRTFDPHVSLCYGAPVNRGACDTEINALLDHPVRFDRLVAMRIPLPVETYDDIRQWTPLGAHDISERV